jgi:diguanylate cyclase (GGDEF)-like protein
MIEPPSMASFRRVAVIVLVAMHAACARDSAAVVSLAGPWSFQPGDRLEWADPAFDSSSWPTIQVPMSWGRQGFDHVTGMAWYRLRVVGPWAADDIIGVQLGKIESAYEAYAGGRKLGGVGKLPPDPQANYDQHTVYSVPPNLRGADGSFVLALRVWREEGSAAGAAGPVEGPYDAGPLLDIVEIESRRETLQLALVFVFLVAAIYHLGLRVMRPGTAEYGWFGLLAIEAALYCFFRTQWKYELFDNFLVMKKFEHVLLYVTLATFVQFIWVFFREPFATWLRVAQAILLAGAVVVIVSPGITVARRLLPLLYAVLAVLIVTLLRLIYRRIRAGDRDAAVVGLGAVIVAAAFTNDAMVERNLFVGPRFGVYGFGVLVLGMSLTLAYRFQRALGDVELLRQDLESRVEARTRELSAAYRRMEELALRDGLTGLLNRRALSDQASSGLSRAKRKHHPFAVAMVDIDHFKAINDTYGHAAGDHVLSQLAQRLTTAVRASDDVGRWGGEEFLVLLPESDREQAQVAAERLRSLIASAPMRIEGDITVKVTVSIGVGLSEDPASASIVLDQIIRTADDALYQAKAAGRNRVVVSVAA